MWAVFRSYDIKDKKRLTCRQKGWFESPKLLRCPSTWIQYLYWLIQFFIILKISDHIVSSSTAENMLFELQSVSLSPQRQNKSSWDVAQTSVYLVLAFENETNQKIPVSETIHAHFSRPMPPMAYRTTHKLPYPVPITNWLSHSTVLTVQMLIAQ